MKSRIERMRAQLADLESLRNKYLFSGKVAQLYDIEQRIQLTKNALKSVQADERHTLLDVASKKILDHMGIGEQMVKMHLVTDFLNDCLATLEEDYRKLGLDLHNDVYDIIYQIKELSGRFAGILCDPDFGDGLDFMAENADLIDSAHALFNGYIYEHVKLK